MAQAFEVHIPIYDKYLYVLIGSPQDSVAVFKDSYDVGERNSKDLLEHLNKYSETSNGLFTHNEISNTFVLWLSQIPDSIKWEGVLIHEINHAVFRLLDELGMEHTSASDEAYSYLSEYLYIEIMNKFNDEQN